MADQTVQIVHMISNEVKGNQLLNQVNSYIVSKKYSDKANECK